MIIPDKAIPFILFQRTGYLRPQILSSLAQVLDKRIPLPMYKYFVKAESLLFSSKVKRLYHDDLRNDYCMIKEYLPTECSKVLDIGCGIAGIDFFLFGHYGESHMDFFLLDKDDVNKRIYYGFRATGAFYNSLAVSKTMLNKNGIPLDNIHLISATTDNNINVKNAKVELIVSLLSWGYHYPVTTYLDQAFMVLKPGGAMILDVRKETAGLDELKKKLNTEIISEEDKYYRVCAYR